MEPSPSDPLSAAFAALADPIRRAILEQLARGEASVGEIAQPFEISAPAISRHLKVMEQAGLVKRRAEGQKRMIALDPQALRRASAWVDRYRMFWEGRMDDLADFLKRQNKEMAMAEQAKELTADELLSVHVSRVFEAPRARVFAAFTDPDLLVRWWGPAGFTASQAEVDLRPGGAYRVTMRRDATGFEGAMGGTFLEIAPPERLVLRITDYCNASPDVCDTSGLGATTLTIVLTDLGDGRTRLDLTQEGFANAVQAEAYDGGWGSSLDKLAAVLPAG